MLIINLLCNYPEWGSTLNHNGSVWEGRQPNGGNLPIEPRIAANNKRIGSQIQKLKFSTTESFKIIRWIVRSNGIHATIYHHFPPTFIGALQHCLQLLIPKSTSKTHISFNQFLISFRYPMQLNPPLANNAGLR